jgi:hypothetical protein
MLEELLESIHVETDNADDVVEKDFSKPISTAMVASRRVHG